MRLNVRSIITNTTVSLMAPVLVSSLACNPTSVGQNASTTCTVTLTQPAPTGGAKVTLSNSNATLTVPASVTVPATATSATFSATTTTISSNSSATITAAYNSSSANTTVSLMAPVLVSRWLQSHERGAERLHHLHRDIDSACAHRRRQSDAQQHQRHADGPGISVSRMLCPLARTPLSCRMA